MADQQQVQRCRSPWQISLDAAGDLFISDPPESRIREVLANGTMASYAGTGVRGFAGNGGTALSARINVPHGVWADASGNIIIGDTGNQLVRAIDPTTQFISSFAGGGNGGSAGKATSGILAGDRATAVDTNGNVGIARHR